MAENSDYILELLKENGLVTPEQIEAGWQKVSESDGAVDIVDALKNIGAITDQQLQSMLAEQYGLEVVDLEGVQISEDLAALVPEEVAKQYRIVPYKLQNGTLTIVMSDPTKMETLDALRYLLQRDVDAVIAPAEQIDKLMIQAYGTEAESSLK